MPPLRERLEDLPHLVDYFLKRHAREFQKPGLTMPSGFMEALYENPWQGNVRELENVLKRAVIMSRGGTLSMPEPVQGHPATQGPGPLYHLPYREAKERVLHSFNQDYLTTLLRRHVGNVTHAARACGLERQSLQQLLRRCDIRAETFRDTAS